MRRKSSKRIHSSNLPSVALHNFLNEKRGESSLQHNKCTSHKRKDSPKDAPKITHFEENIDLKEIKKRVAMSL
ncbi:hypothetical protein POVCU2_0017830 [Plasmodium ovale curtisi]|uniref:Uncharacterized protein n=1 Tax=Plasmodium ovale curtisi TaxID=864141 RepID=A0A1A8VQX0_PLAOA|nr:hypothetical protein POVCU2_0017830 [Plasmodium ovale curtisi]SBS88774.1 hypothetical protein POVCU1_016020 [Plasmodium ovale curtisi]